MDDREREEIKPAPTDPDNKSDLGGNVDGFKRLSNPVKSWRVLIVITIHFESTCGLSDQRNGSVRDASE
jgi:hypothetical protein